MKQTLILQTIIGNNSVQKYTVSPENQHESKRTHSMGVTGKDGLTDTDQDNKDDSDNQEDDNGIDYYNVPSAGEGYGNVTPGTEANAAQDGVIYSSVETPTGGRVSREDGLIIEENDVYHYQILVLMIFIFNCQ